LIHCTAAGLVETLEAEVRSKFQTSRRMSDASQGEVVEVPFDETVVRYYWRSERVFEVVEVELRAKSRAAKELQLLGLAAEGEAESIAQGQQHEEDEKENVEAQAEEGEEIVFEEAAF
jgi:hypothetical protein